MFTARVWWIIVTCLLVNHLGNACLAAGLSLNSLEHHRNFEHRGRHHHGTQTADDSPSEPTTTTSEVEDIGQNIENACCRRQEKYISIGLGASDEDIQLDVGHCQRSCRSLFSPIDLEFADLESSIFKPCPRESACVPSRSRLQRVSTLHGMQEHLVVEECGCRHKPNHCYRQAHTLRLYPGTPYETHLDVGACSGHCESETRCRAVRNKTVSVPGPNGVQCHSVIEECSCARGCYRMVSMETVYDYTDIPDNDTGSSPAVKEVDVGRCTGSCPGAQIQKCLYRDHADPSKCLSGLYGKQSLCTPSHHKVHRYTTKDRQIKEIISITDCKCI